MRTTGISVMNDAYNKIKKYIREDAPTNSMGASSSVAGTGAIDTFDPILGAHDRIHKRKAIDDLTEYLERVRKQ